MSSSWTSCRKAKAEGPKTAKYLASKKKPNSHQQIKAPSLSMTVLELTKIIVMFKTYATYALITFILELHITIIGNDIKYKKTLV